MEKSLKLVQFHSGLYNPRLRAFADYSINSKPIGTCAAAIEALTNLSDISARP